jgi:hypothetical protein
MQIVLQPPSAIDVNTENSKVFAADRMSVSLLQIHMLKL